MRRNREKQQRAFEAWLDRREPALARKVAIARNRYVKTVASQYELAPDIMFSQARIRLEKELTDILKDNYARIIPEIAGNMLNTIRSLKRWPDYQGYFDRLVQRWTTLYAAEKATSIAETAVQDVKRVIARGTKKGESLRAISKAIAAQTALSPYRAMTVAATEVHGASLYAQEEIAKQAQADFGIKLMKSWSPTLDERTRDAHAEMANHPPIPMDDMFTVDGERMSRPGDPRGSAANTIRCRCALIVEEMEFDIQ